MFCHFSAHKAHLSFPFLAVLAELPRSTPSNKCENAKGNKKCIIITSNNLFKKRSNPQFLKSPSSNVSPSTQNKALHFSLCFIQSGTRHVVSCLLPVSSVITKVCAFTFIVHIQAIDVGCLDKYAEI